MREQTMAPGAGRWWPWLGTVARVVLGVVWIWAALLKLPHPESSVTAVRAYQLLPTGTATVVGHLLVVLELVVGAIVLIGLLTRLGGALSAVLQLAFVIGIASVWARGISISCGCFGDGGYDPNAAAHYPWEIARDVGLLGLSLLLVWRGRTALALDNVLFPAALPERQKGRVDVEVQP